MAWSYKIDVSRERVLSTYSDVFTDRDYGDHRRAVGADPLFRAHFDQLIDSTGVTKTELSGRRIRKDPHLSPFSEGSRRAIVAVNDAAYGMARMYAAHRDRYPDEIRVFRRLEDARDWLDKKSASSPLHPPATVIRG